MSGWSMYLDTDGAPNYLYNCFGRDFTKVAGERLEPGRHVLVAHYDHDGGFGAGGEVHLIVDDIETDRARMHRTVPVVFSMSGETFDVGIDTGAAVGPYPERFACTALIHGVTLERLSTPDRATQQARADGDLQAGLRSQ